MKVYHEVFFKCDEFFKLISMFFILSVIISSAEGKGFLSFWLNTDAYFSKIVTGAEKKDKIRFPLMNMTSKS